MNFCSDNVAGAPRGSGCHPPAQVFSLIEMGNAAMKPKAVRRTKISVDARPLWSTSFVDDLAKAARSATRNVAAAHRAAGHLPKSNPGEPPTRRGAQKA
jgi:hypothetical protein